MVWIRHFQWVWKVCGCRGQACQGLYVPCAVSAAFTLQREGLLTVCPAIDHRHSPCPLTGLPHNKLAASRRHSMVMPSLAPDKTSARLRKNPRPPDRAACNTNVLHKGERWTQTFHMLGKGLTFCHHALCIPGPDNGCIYLSVFHTNFRTAWAILMKYFPN